MILSTLPDITADGLKLKIQSRSSILFLKVGMVRFLDEKKGWENLPWHKCKMKSGIMSESIFCKTFDAPDYQVCSKFAEDRVGQSEMIDYLHGG
jgi:hypothetical protein